MITGQKNNNVVNTWNIYNKYKSWKVCISESPFQLNEDWIVIGNFGWYDYSFGNQNSTEEQFNVMYYNEAKNKNVLNSLIHELRSSESFIFSVAFITEEGLAKLKIHLLELKERGIRGRILTSDYLYFNTLEMFKELLKLENVSLRVTNL